MRQKLNYTDEHPCAALSLTASKVRLIICSLACVRTWIVTSSGIIFCSINVRRNWYSVSRRCRNPTRSAWSRHPEASGRILFFSRLARLDQCLIPIPQIHAAPDGRFFNMVFLHPVIARHRRQNSSFIFSKFFIASTHYITSIYLSFYFVYTIILFIRYQWHF